MQRQIELEFQRKPGKAIQNAIVKAESLVGGTSVNLQQLDKTQWQQHHQQTLQQHHLLTLYCRSPISSKSPVVVCLSSMYSPIMVRSSSSPVYTREVKLSSMAPVLRFLTEFLLARFFFVSGCVYGSGTICSTRKGKESRLSSTLYCPSFFLPLVRFTTGSSSSPRWNISRVITVSLLGLMASLSLLFSDEFSSSLD